MDIRKGLCSYTWVIAGAVALSGCGGGGGGTSGPSPKSAPTATTKTRTTAHLAALGQGALSISFAGFGSVTTHHGQTFLVPMLGLYDTVQVAPDGLNETLTLDSTKTQPAGKIQYISEDVGVSFAGTISLTAGRYSGLTGNYLQSVVPGGFSGNEAYSLPGVATTSGEFSLTQDSSGNTTGTEQFAVALASGYTQNEQIVLLSTGAETFTTSDVNGYTSVFNFLSDGSGSGTIKGADAGLPAAVTWDGSGTGQVTFADGTIALLKYWQLSAG